MEIILSCCRRMTINYAITFGNPSVICSKEAELTFRLVIKNLYDLYAVFVPNMPSNFRNTNPLVYKHYVYLFYPTNTQKERSFASIR